MDQEIPEGWYADPQGSEPGRQRWWSGHHWTAHTRVREQPPPAGHAPGREDGAAAHDDRQGRAAATGSDLIDRFRSLPRALADGTRLAEPVERAGAHVVDLLLVWIVANLVSATLELALGVTGWFLLPLDLPRLFFAGWMHAASVVVVWLGYQLLVGRNGVTVGKRLLHLRVRPADADGPLTSGQVLRRSVVGGGGVLFLVFPGAQPLGALLVGYDVYRMTHDPLGLTWHDQVAGTAVVRARP